MTTKCVLEITKTSTCNQNLHREVKQNFSQRSLNYEVTTASGFWLSLTCKEKLMSDISQVPACWGGWSFPCHTQCIHSKWSAPRNSDSECRICSTAYTLCCGVSNRPGTYWAREEERLAPFSLSLCKSLSKPYHRRLLMGYFVTACSLCCLM